MEAHIVLAHPEPKSFNAHLADVMRTGLEQSGWSVAITDLYDIGFDPLECGEHYPSRLDPVRFDAQAEQRYASDQDSLPKDVRRQIEILDRADLLILQYPMWWHLPPAMLKGWMDRVFVYGHVYTSAMRFENGRFRSKRAMLSVTVGTSRETYAHNGRSGDIDLLLWPVHFSLAYVGYSVLPPFIAYGVEAGLRYTDPLIIQERLKRLTAELATRIQGIDGVPPIAFNRMSEWSEGGTIKPEAPVYSPFIRHRKSLDLK